LVQELEPVNYGRAVAKRIELRLLAGDRRGAVAAGIDGLRRLGMALPDGEQPTAALELASIDLEEVRGLGTRRRIRDGGVKAILEVISALLAVTSMVDAALHGYLVREHLRLLLAHGRHVTAPLAAVQAAMMLAAAPGGRSRAEALAEVARALAAKEGPNCPRHRVEPGYWFIATWTRPFAEALTPLREAVTWAIEAGDLDSASNATLMQVSLVFAAGLHLRSLERSSNVAAHRMQQWQAGEQEIMARVFERFAGLLLAGDPEAVEARLEDPFDLAAL
ncbi:MAG: hypothetical protein KC431_15760, partial [Myxococcales bacterium]|nr:hypothetical protein [Myxococcales bacterium]